MTIHSRSTSTLLQEVTSVFAPGGPLADSEPSYHPRSAQLAMAQGVVGVMESQSVLVCEAGTGVGKTFAYLVPVLLSGARTLLSTATKSLQDQLFLRDLPRLGQALGVPISCAMLKGRSSYLCTHRLAMARQTALPDRWAERSLAHIEQWSQATRTGDLAEIDALDEHSPLVALVTSTRDNCLGSDCPQFNGCHVFRARRQALAADVVVINHHLFFADLDLKNTGIAELLPSVEVIVFDEAHQLPDAGLAFLGENLGSAQLVDFFRDLRAIGPQQAPGLVRWAELIHACEHAMLEWRSTLLGDAHPAQQVLKLKWEERAHQPEFERTLATLERSLQTLVRSLETVAGASAELDKLLERAESLAQRATSFSTPTSLDVVRWIELSPLHARMLGACRT